MYIKLYILDMVEHVTILLVDKTTLVMIYKASQKILLMFVILVSQQTDYHIQITKGKGSECFMASKTPVGHVMTWFESVHNITPRLKVIIPDHPNLHKTGFGVLVDDCLKALYGSVYFSWDQIIKLMVSKNGILVFSLGDPSGHLLLCSSPFPTSIICVIIFVLLLTSQHCWMSGRRQF